MKKSVIDIILCVFVFSLFTYATIWLSVHISLWFCLGYCMLFILGTFVAMIYDMNNDKKKK